MIISTRGRYALRVMIDLAGQDPNTYTPLKEIAARQEISEKYLENILKSLVTGGLIFGLRGKGGGYKLTKKPEDYTISSILRLTEDHLHRWHVLKKMRLNVKGKRFALPPTLEKTGYTDPGLSWQCLTERPD